jgi:hypothetical protein
LQQDCVDSSKGWRPLFAAALALLLLAQAHADTLAPDDAATLAQATLLASDRQSTLLRVTRFGRYAITAESPQGTALQLIDRMAGPGAVRGTPGEQDGRLDLFLDRGEYRLVTHGHEKGSGEVALAVHGFTELAGAEFPQLVEHKPVTTTLDDLKQHSYWLHLTQRRQVVLEAAGRNLADLRLWRDGSWLVDAEPKVSVAHPAVGRPLTLCQIDASLEPGLYRLTAYGGPPQPWTQDADQHPLHLRYGIPRLAAAARQRFELSPFGTDRYLVPGEANYFRLSLPEARAATLSVADYQEGSVFSGHGNQAAIDKESVPPVAEVETPARTDALHLVTVSAQAGEPYLLQHFENSHEYRFHGSGRYWISTIHSGSAADSIDATSILTRRYRGRPPQFFHARVVTLDAEKVFKRRFNLLEPLTLYLEVPSKGEFYVSGEGEGARARYRIEPFLTDRPRDYEAPPYQPSGHLWELDAGYYVLTLEPELKGILELSIARKNAFFPPREAAADSVAGATRYEQISLDDDYAYTLYTNRQAGVKVGVVLRRLPIDLGEPLPVSQRAGETVTVAVRLAEPGEVRATAVTGEALELRADGGAWQEQLELAAGSHRVAVRNPRPDTIDYALQWLPRRLARATPLPPLPKGVSRAVPDFPELSAAAPRHLDLDRNERATFKLRVDQPSLYRLESSGLLETEGNLRTRTNPELMRQRANGVGRNFLIQQYLREGDYQLTVQTRGKSRGHLGIALSRTALVAGGALRPGVPARASLGAGQGLAYRFSVPETDKYRIRAIGVGRTYSMRLEDGEGWPVITPGAPADRQLEVEPGSYRLIIDPEAVERRVVTLLEHIPAPVELEGHGPHPLSLDKAAEHTWTEPAGAGERVPDRWEIAIPAPIDASISVTGEMQGRVVRLDPKGESAGPAEVATVTARRVWEGKLASGRYAILLTNSRRNNQVSYTLKVASRQLTAGQSRQVTAPADLPIAVGRESLVELGAYGSLDVRARLYDARDRLIDQNDDSSDDWNFLIARKLAAGEYRLRIESLSGPGATTVSMRVPQEQVEPALEMPAEQRIADENLHTYPLKLSGKPTMLVVAADSEDTVGLAVEAEQGSGWQVLGTTVGRAPRLLVPLASDRKRVLRLRLWSVDRRGAPIRLGADAYSPGVYSEAELARSAAVLKVPALVGFGRAVASVKLSRPGVLRLRHDTDVSWSAKPGQVLRPVRGGLLVATGDRVWLAAPLPPGENQVRLGAQRVQLSRDGDASLQFYASADALTRVDLEAPREGPLLAVAESRAGQPGLQLVEKADAGHAPSPAGLGVAGDSVVSVMLRPREPVAQAWNAGDRAQPLEMKLYAYRLPPPGTEVLARGITQGVLEARQARAFTLGAGTKRIALVLPARCAAVLSQGGKPLSTHWSGAAPMAEALETEASRLTLLHLGEQPRDFRLEIAESAGAGPGLAPGDLFQRQLATRGVLRMPLRLKGRQGYTLRVRGPVQATLVGDSGQIHRGRDLAIGEGGILLLAHDTGLVLAWLESASAAGPEAWAAAPARPRRVVPPETLSVEGTTQRLEVETAGAAMLHARSDTPSVTRVVRPAVAQEVEAHPRGTRLDICLPKGTTAIGLHPIAAERLSGSVSLSMTPAVTIGEGLGPRSLLEAGGGRLYAFAVKQRGPVGIGVQASSDVVSGVLMDDQCRAVGAGVVQMPTLDPGEYLLAVRVPPQSPPVRVRPVLAGIEPPDTGPPVEVVRQYLERAGLKMEGTEPE